MIKYIKKLIKKQKLLKEYKSQIDDNLILLSYINNKNSILIMDSSIAHNLQYQLDSEMEKLLKEKNK